MKLTPISLSFICGGLSTYPFYDQLWWHFYEILNAVKLFLSTSLSYRKKKTISSLAVYFVWACYFFDKLQKEVHVKCWWNQSVGKRRGRRKLFFSVKMSKSRINKLLLTKGSRELRRSVVPSKNLLIQFAAKFSEKNIQIAKQTKA